MSVAAPSVVPSIITFAPIKGSPVSLSVITPDSLPVVPEKRGLIKRRAKEIERNLFFRQCPNILE
jgi:hypothetical protein